MLTSRAFGRLPEALRAHDTRGVEQLAERQKSIRYKPVGNTEDEAGGMGAGRAPGGRERICQGSAEVLSTPRDPAQLAAFIRLRVLNPEHEHWRRGIEARIS
ncbi:hypothetical protein ACWDUX_15795 [Streptomyces sp. NPDC003444]